MAVIKEKKSLLIELGKMKTRVEEIAARAALDPANKTADDIAFSKNVEERQVKKKMTLEKEIIAVSNDLDKAKRVFNECVNESEAITMRMQATQNREAKKRKEEETTASLFGMDNFSTARPMVDVSNIYLNNDLL